MEQRLAKPADGLYDIMPEDHRAPYEMKEVLDRILDADDFLEFQPDYAPEFLCANARLSGYPVARNRESARAL